MQTFCGKMSMGFLGALLTLKMNAIYECPLVLSAANRSTSVGRYGWRAVTVTIISGLHARGRRRGHAVRSPLIRAGPQCRRTKERPLFYGSARPFYVLQLASLQSLPSIFELSDMCQKNTKIVNVWFILLRLAPKHETQLNCN